MKKLQLALTKTSLPDLGRATHVPQARVVLGRNGQWLKTSVLALVDTGAAVTLVSRKLAPSLGITQAELASAPVCRLGSFSQDFRAHQVALDIKFLGAVANDSLLLDNAAAFVTDRVPGGFLVAIGQHDSLERLEFVQRNQVAFRDFILKTPAEPRRGGAATAASR